MVMRVVCVWCLALFARMRLLRGVIDIVVRPYSIVARQCAFDAWVPPERTALDGRRSLYRKNLMDWSPSGLLMRWRLRGGSACFARSIDDESRPVGLNFEN